MVSPTVSVCAGIASATSGAGLGCSTVTVKATSAERSPVSVAETVTVALPSATASTVNVSPESDAVATAASELVAAKVSASPSGSVNSPATSAVKRIADIQGLVFHRSGDRGRAVHSLHGDRHGLRGGQAAGVACRDRDGRAARRHTPGGDLAARYGRGGDAGVRGGGRIRERVTIGIVETSTRRSS